MKPTHLVVLLLVVCAPASADSELGLVLVVGGDPQAFTFEVPAGAEFSLQYSLGMEVLDAPEGDVIAPGETLIAPESLGDWDGDGDYDLRDFAEFQICYSGTAPFIPGCEPFDLDGDGDVDFADHSALVPWFTGPRLLNVPGDYDADGDFDLRDFAEFQVCFSGESAHAPGCEPFDVDEDGDVDTLDFEIIEPWFAGPHHLMLDVPITLYARGLAPSSLLGDKLIEVYVDGEVVASQVVTVVQLTVIPTTVSYGTAMVAELEPTGGPLVFDEDTTASWAGDFQPSVGAPIPVTIAYDADEVLERSDSQCVLVAGAGSSDTPLEAFLSDGELIGSFTFDLNGLLISASHDITVAEGPANIYTIEYSPEMVPSLGEPSDEINVFPAPVPDEETMVFATAHHYCVVVPVEKTPETLGGPMELTVQVMTLNADYSVIQDSFELTLTRDDTDPDYIRYISDLEVPLFPINVDVDPTQYTEVWPFETVDDGVVVVVEEEVAQ